ncbi:ATP synthase subunit I [Oceanobacillus sp. 1P07AA]|uniref:ATP synthase subunit I n=1 Tax=Oceanobacillus sp. 1P07AA TaxID=3132293 RepID=UPI0039A42D86
MSNYDKMITRQRQWMFYLLAVLVLCAGFLPYPRVFFGLILGSIISLYNLWLLQSKTAKLGETVAAGGKARGGLGTFTRMAAAVLGVLIAMRFEEHFHVMAVIIGILSSYFVIALDIIVYQLSLRNQEED